MTLCCVQSRKSACYLMQEGNKDSLGHFQERLNVYVFLQLVTVSFCYSGVYEWRLIATVLDRLFLLVFLIIVIVSSLTLLPK